VTVRSVWLAQTLGLHQALQSAPMLINVVDSTPEFARRADSLRQQKITPTIR
jgi:hypothetical protein